MSDVQLAKLGVATYTDWLSWVLCIYSNTLEKLSIYRNLELVPIKSTFTPNKVGKPSNGQD